MDTGRIAKRYAKAAYEYAVESKEEKALYEEMNALSESYFSFPRLRSVVEDPTVSFENKKKILTTASGISVSNSCLKLIDLVLKNRREAEMQFVSLIYQSLYREMKGIVVLKITTATEVDPNVLEQIESVVKASSAKEVDPVSKIDPSILGGFILEIDDKRIDASVRGQLYKLKNQLVEENKLLE